VHQREPVSVDDLALYPLFTPELIQLMRMLIPLERQAAVATSVVLTARRSSARQASGIPP
jgi:arsenite methyltransferase